MKISGAYIGVISSVVVAFLVAMNFSEGCSNEIVSQLLMLLPTTTALGGGVILKRRYDRGDINVLGVKK